MHFLAFLALLSHAHASSLALTPPMGFMTWQLFRCNGAGAAGSGDDCTDPNTTYCISSALIRGQAAAMYARGFAAAGYRTVSIVSSRAAPGPRLSPSIAPEKTRPHPTLTPKPDPNQNRTIVG